MEILSEPLSEEQKAAWWPPEVLGSDWADHARQRGEAFDMRMLTPALVPAAYRYIRTQPTAGSLFRINVVLERAFWRGGWHGGFCA